MSTLWFMNYNNYANRIVKKESSLSAYGTAGRNVFNKPKIDFNPNDGVTTTLIVDAPANRNPDYMLVVDTINNVDTITSRWFVIEWTRTRGGQYRANLKRDALIDNLDTIASSPILVQKGTVKTADDICIYQKENIEYNQIKKKEILLHDDSGVGWIIGFYTDPTFVDSDGQSLNDQTLTTTYRIEPNYKVNSLNDYPYYTYDSQDPYYYYDRVRTSLFVTNEDGEEYYVMNSDGTYNLINLPTMFNCQFDSSQTSYVVEFGDLLKNNQRQLQNIIFSTYPSINKVDLFGAEDGKIIEDASSTPHKFYKIHVSKENTQATINITSGSETEEEVVTYMQDLDDNLLYDTSANRASVNCNFYGYKMFISLEEINTSQISCTYPDIDNARKLVDAPYYMFAIPYGQMTVFTAGSEPRDPDSEYFVTCDKEYATNIARELVDKLKGNVNDIQLLPFCPIPNILKIDQYNQKYISVTALSSGKDYVIMTDSGNNDKAIIFLPSYSSFNGTIKLSDITNININVPINVEDFKIENETKKFRLTSPNFASMFEFKNTYNQKNILNFNYRCTYRPYNSFVNVYPKEIGGLYGSDYRDNFGLIFQGDFSLPILNNSEWKNYQINNKNYQNSFNRSIDTFDLEAKWSQAQDIVGAVSGTVSGVAQGAMAGGVAGAIVGGVASAGAGVMDIVANEQMRQNKRGEMIDQFNFSLENVQARPRTIANVGTFDINNKIFPILEIFDCTDEEKEILRMKLRYTGYTINKIAYLSDYMGGYFKGVVIFNEDIDEDSHVQEVINEELGKGVYTNGLSI